MHSVALLMNVSFLCSDDGNYQLTFDCGHFYDTPPCSH